MKLNTGADGSISTGNNNEENTDVAGTPYWMAPEIVEMSTPTSACDIW